MEKISENINRFLPFGEMLRDVLHHPTLTQNDHKKLLKLKGVFVENGDDDTTFPLLVTSIISPSEFDFLKEKLQEREDRNKPINRSIAWASSDNLFSALPQKIDVRELIKTSFPKYKLVGDPNFSKVNGDPNNIQMPFKCETLNLSKAWYRTKNEFTGQINIIKSPDGNKISMQIIHTSPETFEVGDKVVKKLEKHFKELQHIPKDAQVQRILYRDFNNKQRITFFMRLLKGDALFSFNNAPYVSFAPDQDQAMPDNINWLEQGQVKVLSINGKALDKIPYLSEEVFHDFIEIGEMEAVFQFAYHAAEGNCRVRFGFPGYLPSRKINTEFVLDIVKINLTVAYAHVPHKSVHRYLLAEFEKYKSSIYDLFKYEKLAADYSPDLSLN